MNRLYKPFLIVSWLLLLGAFTSTSLGQLTVTAPNGGETFSPGPTMISWTEGTGVLGTVHIEYSLDGGGTFSTIAAGVANPAGPNSLPWIVPSFATPAALIRISYDVFAIPPFGIVPAPTHDVSDAPFTISLVPSTPTPTPVDASVGVSQGTAAVSFTAFDNGGPTGSYDIQLAKNVGFSVDIEGVSATSATSYTIVDNAPLLYNTTYYWRVRDSDIDGGGSDGPWNTFSFTTELAAPVLSSPADVAPGQDLDVTLSWGSVSGANQYTLEVNTDPGFGGGTAIAVLGQPQVGTSRAPRRVK